MSAVSILATLRFAAIQPGQANCGDNTGCDTGLPVVNAGSVGTDELQQILQIVFAVMGAIAVLMIVIAGFRFVIAQGNPQDIAKARKTIIYSVIGLVVALTAEAIVSLVLSRV